MLADETANLVILVERDRCPARSADRARKVRFVKPQLWSIWWDVLAVLIGVLTVLVAIHQTRHMDPCDVTSPNLSPCVLDRLHPGAAAPPK